MLGLRGVAVNPELEIVAATVREHHYDELFQVCACDRVPVRTHEEHVADEIELALRNAGFGIFLYERLGLLDEL